MSIIEFSNIIVLVVDDSPESLGMLNATLNKAGLTVLVALSGAQALSIVEKVQPDVVLLDAIMPEMDGFDTCQKLKEKLPSTPIIFMTGLNDSEHVIHGFEVGGVDYITKPVVPDEVLARIKVHSHNAKLAKSAQFALDYAGQYIFCVSKQGRLEWATPYLITIMIQPLRTILRVSCSGGFNHGQEQGSVSKKHEYSCLYSALWQ